MPSFDEQGYDLILRDPEGGHLMRWFITNDQSKPCLGDGKIVTPKALYDEIVDTVTMDKRLTKE
jgi:hypothetical protein